MSPTTRDAHARYSGRTETSLRLWLVMGICAALSTLLCVAMTVARPEALAVWPRGAASPPIFAPSLRNMLAFVTQRAQMQIPPHSSVRSASDIDRVQAGDSNASLSGMQLVETLPVGAFALTSTLPQTHDVLLKHTQAATTSIDISAMYWNLLGDDDHKVYSDADMARFGADRGQQLFQALVDATKRGVRLRVLTAGDAIGSSEDNTGETALPSELQRLVALSPAGSVSVHTWSGPDWYGGGILHQKIWVFDRRDVYIGSANMDWKSLAQVMEMGVLLRDLAPTSPVLRDVQRLFDVWWLWGAPDLHVTRSTREYESARFQARLQVPAWSLHVAPANRTRDPFVAAGLRALGNMTHQLHTRFADGTNASMFVAAAPVEATAAGSRAFDEDALVYTIQSARSRVSLSVMDFTPYSMYPLKRTHNAPIWWPALTDALLAGVFGKRGLHVRLLISEWQHSRREMFDALRVLEQQAALCAHMRPPCAGKLEIKIFRVPGWQNTTAPVSETTTTSTAPLWPAFTRVNHAKFIVSDQRVNIGTSNMEWGYFYTTAGISVNTDHEPTRHAMESVFNRNWDSPYAQPLTAHPSMENADDRPARGVDL